MVGFGSDTEDYTLLLHTAIYQVVATCMCLLKVFMCYTQYLQVQYVLS